MSLRCMLAVLDRSQARLGARLVLLALAEYAHDDGTNAFPSVPTIATKANLSERAVHDALRQLERDGEIRRAGQTPRRVTIWTVTPGGSAENSPDLLKDGSVLGSGEEASPLRRRQLQGTPAESAPLERWRRWSTSNPDAGTEVAEYVADDFGLEGPERDAALAEHRTRHERSTR